MSRTVPKSLPLDVEAFLSEFIPDDDGTTKLPCVPGNQYKTAPYTLNSIQVGAVVLAIYCLKKSYQEVNALRAEVEQLREAQKLTDRFISTCISDLDPERL